MTKLAFMLTLTIPTSHEKWGASKRKETQDETEKDYGFNGQLTEAGRTLLDVESDAQWLHTLPFNDWLLNP